MCKIIYCIAFILFYFKVFIVVCLGCTAIGKTYLFHITVKKQTNKPKKKKNTYLPNVSRGQTEIILYAALLCLFPGGLHSFFVTCKDFGEQVNLDSLCEPHLAIVKKI